MSDLLADGVDWLESQRIAYVAQTVEYGRGVQSVELSCTMGTTTYEATDEDGFSIQETAVDFMFAASSLILGDSVVLPKLGDWLRHTVGDEVRLYEVLDIGGGGHYRYSDPFGKRLRVHAKLTGTEPA
jgi:hypothetical protein